MPRQGADDKLRLNHEACKGQGKPNSLTGVSRWGIEPVFRLSRPTQTHVFVRRPQVEISGRLALQLQASTTRRVRAERLAGSGGVYPMCLATHGAWKKREKSCHPLGDRQNREGA